VLVRSRRHQSRLFQRREVRLRCPEAHLVSRMFPDRSSWASCGGSPAPCYCESGVWESRLGEKRFTPAAPISAPNNPTKKIANGLRVMTKPPRVASDFLVLHRLGVSVQRTAFPSLLPALIVNSIPAT